MQCHPSLQGATEDSLPLPRELEGEGRASIRDIGFGDLLLARETLIGYEAREIAHIENVMSGEHKIREHERTKVREEVNETERTTEESTERDLETSDRFELQTESASTIDTDFSISAGVNTSGKYGLTKVDTNVDTSFSSSSQESRRSATTTAQDIVSKSVHSIQERVRELRRVTTRETVRELARHEFNNQPEPGSSSEGRSSAYLWVDKLQQVDLRHYGTRLLLELTVPEPGVSLIESLQAADDPQGQNPRH